MNENRRAADIQIPDLIDKIVKLDDEVKQLRRDFEGHVFNEDESYKSIKFSLDNLQKTVEQLVIEINEPLESYKAAKYGVVFLQWIAGTAKWLIPLIVALSIGYGLIDKIK